MAIRTNSGYNSPEIAAVAANLADMFGPPSAQDTAAYSVAAKNRQATQMQAQLVQMATDPNFDQSNFDRFGAASGAWTPNQGYWSVEQNNNTQRYGYDTQAATQRANNLLDNQTKLATSFAGPTNPEFSSLGLGPELADHFAMPGIAPRAGTPGPLSETEWKAGQLEELRLGGDYTTEELLGIAGSDSSAQEKIARLTQQFIDTGLTDDPAEARNLAIGITDGRLKDSRHPVTGEVVIVDMATGRPVEMSAPAPVGTGDPVMDIIAPSDAATDFGPQYPAAGESFGVGGALAGGINTVLDATGVGAPYKDIQQSQADFGVLRESLLNDISGAYGRQPPSWLLQEIRNLTPAAGNPFEGAGGAVSKLNAIGRQLTNELQIARQALERELSPANRQEMEATLSGLQAGIARVGAALDAFGPQGGGQPAGDAPDADGWVTLPNGVRIREKL